jgi:hypothetical protein
MTTTAPAPVAARTAPDRNVARAGGIWYLLTFAASMPALVLYGDVLGHPGYITGSGSDLPLLWGAWLEVVTAIACVATAVVLYPVTRRVSRGAALGFVTARIAEAGMIAVGVLALLSVVTLKHDLAGATGAEATSLTVTGRALVALHDWTFLLGPGLIPGINALCLGYVLYRSRLVPRAIPAIGLIGAPVILVTATGVIFGQWTQVSPVGALGALPIAVWEFSLGVYLTFRGFRRTDG